MRTGKQLTRKQMAAYCALSTRAKQVFTRLMEGRFYQADFGRPKSKIWTELMESGLVCRGGRVVTLAAYYVPAGTKPFVCETFPTWPPLSMKAQEIARGKP